MGRWCRRMLFSIQFLTRYPLHFSLELETEDYSQSTSFFPVAGLLVGVFAAAVCWFGHLTMSNMVAAAFYTLGSVWITGAFHIDGAADTADSFGGIMSARRMLNMMKNSTVRLRGITAIILDLILKTFLVYLVLERMNWINGIWFLFIVSVYSKVGSVSCCFVSRSARRNGLGKSFIDGTNFKNFIVACLEAFFIIMLFTNWMYALFLCLLSVFMGIVISWAISRKLNGITGDTLGLVNEACEIIGLGTILLIHSRIAL